MMAELPREDFIKMEDQRRFWNEWNTKSREQNRKLPIVNQRQAQMVIEWIKSAGKRDLDILEVGCGAGWLCEQLIPFGKVTGTDLSDEVLSRAAVNLPQVKFVAGNFFDLDFPQLGFDFIVSLEVLAHVDNQDEFVEKIAKLLRPGGYFAIATQNKFILSRWSQVAPKGEDQIRKWVDIRTLKHLLSKRFEIVSITSIVPVGDCGILRWTNAPKINKILSVLASPSRIESFKERFFLGHTLMALARKPA